MHDVNPNVPIIAGGLRYGTDLAFLKNNTLDTTRFQNKLVYAFHWYEWSHLDPQGSSFKNASDAVVCYRVQANVHANNGFLLNQSCSLSLASTWTPRTTLRIGSWTVSLTTWRSSTWIGHSGRCRGATTYAMTSRMLMKCMVYSDQQGSLSAIPMQYTIQNSTQGMYARCSRSDLHMSFTSCSKD